MDVNVYSLAGNLIRELRDKIKADIEKEVYGLTAKRGKDMKEKVDCLEAEVSRLRKENGNLRFTTGGKVLAALPGLAHAQSQRLAAENDDLRDTIASDDATRRNMKVTVDRLEAEIESLHSVIKLKDDRLTWWRQTVDGKNRTIKILQERVDAPTFYPPESEVLARGRGECGGHAGSLPESEWKKWTWKEWEERRRRWEEERRRTVAEARWWRASGEEATWEMVDDRDRTIKKLEERIEEGLKVLAWTAKWTWKEWEATRERESNELKEWVRRERVSYS